MSPVPTDFLPRIEALSTQARAQYVTTSSYPPDFKDLVVAYARSRRCAGDSWASIAQPLPVSSTAVRRWCDASPSAASGLVPVRVVDDDPSPPPSRAPCDGLLVLTSPRGFRLDGLTLEQAALLLGRLG